MKENPHLMHLVQHLADLRRALIHSIIALIIGTSLTLYYSKELFALLIHPLELALPKGSHFITTTPFESYMVYIKTAFLAGALLAAPYIAYQIWRFVSPGLYKTEKNTIVWMGVLSAFFFVVGALFGYFFVFPTGFKFVVDILNDTPILFMPKMEDYFSFSSKFLLAFGITFELPLIILMLSRVGLIDYSHIHKFRKYAIILIFVIAGILTPGPDILSQFMMATPLLVLYELGGLGAYFFGKKKVKENTEENPT